jgi:branched-chain amino acid aminotransferase
MAFRADRIVKELVAERKPLVPLDGVLFGTLYTDHMLFAECVNCEWKSIKIIPFQEISLPPEASIFHYSMTAFEGLKAFRDAQGRVRLFRPNLNCERLCRSCERLGLPELDADEVLKALVALLRVDARWVPARPGFSLYIRPTIIGTTPSLGVQVCHDALFYIILSPVGPYYRTGFKPVSLWACTDFARAWIGGTGSYKLGANYAICMRPQQVAWERGCQQVLWLYGAEEYITEVGAMNLIGIWFNRAGEKELITASLDDGLILRGVTRDSILTLAREEGELKVNEGRWTIPELLEALAEKRVLEVFGCGTAAIVAPVNRLLYKEQWYDVPLKADDPAAQIGPYAEKFLLKLQAIQYGAVEHPWSVVVTE